MSPTVFAAGLPIALAVLGASAQPVAEPSGFETSSQLYRCTGGARLPVVYLNLKGGESFATTYVNGHLVLMRSGPAASGVRYVAVDESLGYRWHVKGEVGSLFYLGVEPGAREALVLQDCKAQRQP